VRPIPCRNPRSPHDLPRLAPYRARPVTPQSRIRNPLPEGGLLTRTGNC